MTLPAVPSMYVATALSLAVVAVIGAFAWRRTRDSRDFFLAGQRLGPWVTGIAAATAAFSGFVFLGGPGLTYRIGIASWFIILPIGFTPGLLCFAAARRLRRLASDPDVLTVPDALRARWGGRAVPGLATIAVLVGSTAYLAVQVLAAGRLLEAVLGLRGAVGVWSLPLAMGLGLVVVLAYSAAGGMVAGVATDVFQGALMTATAIALFAVATRAVGGWPEAVATILGDGRFGRAFLDPVGGAPVTTVVGFLFVFGVGVLGQPHMLHKFMMIAREDSLRWMPVVLGGAQSLCLLVWIGLGLAVPALVVAGEMAAPRFADGVVPGFLIGFTPGPLAGLAVAGALAAILSTSDSFVNLGSAALVRDLPRTFGRPVGDELRRGRLATVVLGVGAGVVAWAWDDLIALLGGLAFGTFAAALAPVVGVGLAWPRVSARVAAASIATGIFVHLGLEGWSRISAAPKLLATGASPAAVALAGSFLTLLLGAALFPVDRERSAPSPGARGGP